MGLRRWWENRSDEFRFITGMYIAVFALVSIVSGLINGFDNGCKYKSIMSRVNIPYVVTCELIKERF